MVFRVLAMVLVGLTISFLSGAESAACPTGTVAMNVALAADIQILTDILNCTGRGDFDVTWHSNQTLAQRIEVSNMKNVSVTGSGNHTIHGGLGDDNDGGAVIHAGGGTGIFSVSDGSKLSLTNVVLAGGNASRGGAIELVSDSSLFVYDCGFTNNYASDGGAVYGEKSNVYIGGSTYFGQNVADEDGGAVYGYLSNVYISGSTYFEHNMAEEAGGAMEVRSADVYMEGNTTFVDNWSYTGGAIDVRSSDIYMEGQTRFVNNSAHNGGAMDTSFSDVYMNGSTTFFNNSAGDYGGAMDLYTSVVHMEGNVSFANNSAGADGGAMDVDYSTVYMNGSTSFSHNSASDSGGAMSGIGSDVYIEDSTSFVKNWAFNFGGAMDVDMSEVYMRGYTSFVNNGAEASGGSIDMGASEVYMQGNTSFVNNWSASGGSMDVSTSKVFMEGNTTFANNSAAIRGGAMAINLAEVYMEGKTSFVNNWAETDGGAIYCDNSSIVTTGGMNRTIIDLPGNKGEVYNEVEADASFNTNIRFIGNAARGLGGAIHVNGFQQLGFRGVAFVSNDALLGGAMYIASPESRSTEFSGCVFESNGASEGGAMYLATGSGDDRFATSVFRDNSAEFSGGAIFHIGSLHAVNTSFVANKAGVEGPAIISIGRIKELSNVSFSGNSFNCRATKYGYVVDQEESGFCNSCFDKVCARCSTGQIGVTDFEGVRTNGTPVCEDPPAGAIAESSGTTVETLSLEEGFYRTSNQSHAIIECYHSSACVGGNDAASYCAPGYTGPYCAVCVDGYTAGLAYTCNICSGDMKRSALGLTIAVGLAALLMTALVFAYLGRVVRDGTGEDTTDAARRSWGQKCWSWLGCLAKMLPLRAIKIVVTVWQIISQFDAVAGDVYPELYKAFVAKLTAFNLDLNFVLSYSCLVTTDFYDHLLVATIAPLVVLVMLAVSYFVSKTRTCSSESARRAVRHKHQSALLYFSFFVYSPVSYKIFQTFSCDELDGGKSYLRADYSLSCLTPRHSWYEMYALIMVGAYPVGIAVVFACLLGRYSRDLVKPRRESMLHLRPLHSLWAAYKPSRYYYEVIECGRRVCLTAIASFVPSNSATQISIVLMFAVVWLFISEAISPFAMNRDMNLYRWGNGIIVASMYVAFLARVDVGYDTDHALLTFSGVLILANVFMVVTVLLQTALLVKELRGARERVRAVGPPVRPTACV